MSKLRVSQNERNSARIQHDKRRVRARRKAYLQELEAQLRNCEQDGIEANYEMQEAARKVLEENRTLRSLLYQRGVLESEIVVALGGLPNGPYVNNSSVPTLNTILERGTNCGTLLSTAATGRAASSPRHTPSASPGSTVMGTPPPVSYPAAPFTTPTPPPVPVINSDGLCIESHDTKIKTGDDILMAFYKQPGRTMMH